MKDLARRIFIDGVIGGPSFFAIGLIAIAVSVALIGLLLGAATGADRIGCERSAEAMQRVHRYGFFEGCLIQLNDGTFVPLDQYRSTVEEVGR